MSKYRTYEQRHAPDALEQAPVMLTRWVCGGHTEQAVTPSGKGCPICAKARRDRDAKRSGKRLERRQKDADRARIGRS